jgi:hypothetical protein
MNNTEIIDLALKEFYEKNGHAPFLDEPEDREAMINRFIESSSITPPHVPQPLEVKDGQSILSAIGYDGARILSVEKVSDDCFLMEEQCDSYFDCTLTKAQFVQFIEELKEMAK